MRIYLVVLTIWVGITMKFSYTTVWQLIRHVELLRHRDWGNTYLPTLPTYRVQKSRAFAAQSVSQSVQTDIKWGGDI